MLKLSIELSEPSFNGIQINKALLVALGIIIIEQIKGTKVTYKAVRQLFDYCTTHPKEKPSYATSDMIL